MSHYIEQTLHAKAIMEELKELEKSLVTKLKEIRLVRSTNTDALNRAYRIPKFLHDMRYALIQVHLRYYELHGHKDMSLIEQTLILNREVFEIEKNNPPPPMTRKDFKEVPESCDINFI